MKEQVILNVDWTALGTFAGLLVVWTGGVLALLRWFILREIRQMDERFRTHSDALEANEREHREMESRFREDQDRAREAHDRELRNLERLLGELKTEVAENYTRREDWLSLLRSLETGLERVHRRLDEVAKGFHKRVDEILKGARNG